MKIPENLIKIYRKIKTTLIFKILKVILLILFAALVLYLISNLNIFFIDTVEIRSPNVKDSGKDNASALTYIDEQDIRDIVEEHIGQRIFLVDNQQIQDDLSSRFSFIKEVYVSKRFPSTLSVKIIERTPLIKIVANNEEQTSDDEQNCILIDDQNKILTDCNELPNVAAGLPTCEVTLLNSKEIASTYRSIEVESLIKILEEIKEQNIDLNVLKSFIPQSHVVVLVFEDNTRAVFTTDKAVNDQISDFITTRENLVLKNKSYKEIDLRYERPVIRVDKYTDWVTE
ncbi:FtsQ-type POTRA domain-containing protein [Candidatus Dojkabacteria bacterium]|nr:FtsQ-type POTRA domain-containing protein [Candidatus Dojkabacteria bacterium]